MKTQGESREPRRQPSRSGEEGAGHIRSRRAWLLLGGIVLSAMVTVPLVKSLWPDGKPPETGTDRQEQHDPQQAPPAMAKEESPSPSEAEPAQPAETPPDTRAEVEAVQTEAIEVARQLAEDFPNGADTLAFLGDVHYSLGKSAEAVDYWKKCIQRNPQRADAHFALAKVALKQGEFERAAALCRKTLQIKPDFPGGRERLVRALLALDLNDEAIDVLTEDLQSNPESVNSHYFLAQAYLQSGEYEKARDHFQNVIDVKPDYTNAHYGLATVYARLGQPGKSDEHNRRFRERKAADLEKIRVGKRERHAAADLVEIRANVAGHLTGAARIYRSRRQVPKAEALWQRAAALDPKNTDCRLELATLYYFEGKLPRALALYREVAAIEPENGVGCCLAGKVHVRLNQWDEAEEAFRETIKRSPQRAEGYASLAQLYLRTGRKPVEAKTLAQKAVKLQPTAPNYFLLAGACEKNGDRTAALTAIEQAVKLKPDNDEYRRVQRRIQGGR